MLWLRGVLHPTDALPNTCAVGCTGIPFLQTGYGEWVINWDVMSDPGEKLLVELEGRKENLKDHIKQ